MATSKSPKSESPTSKSPTGKRPTSEHRVQPAAKKAGTRKPAHKILSRPPRKEPPSRTAGAIELLEKDHQKVEKLLDELVGTTARASTKRADLVAQIAEELRIHTQIEEEVFYPAFHAAAAKKADEKLYFEALEEHHVVDLVLPEVERTGPDSAEFAAKAKVLRELVLHHAKEEEKEMFPRAKRLLDKDELAALGTRMAALKEQLAATAASA